MTPTKTSRFSFTKWSTRAPLIILAAMGIVVVSSYFLAGWLMEPLGDDYDSLLAYHNAHWLTSLPHIVVSGGGRYAQTIVSVTMYGALGIHGLKIAAFLSVGLFLLAAYCVLLAWQKSRKLAYNHKIAAIGAVIFFLFYTMFSASFPWIRGGIDNSFQDLLWVPGFITYTLPCELLMLVVSGIVLFADKVKRRGAWLVGLVAAGMFVGMFSEIVPIAFTELVCILLAYHIVRNRKLWRASLRRYIPFFTVALGALIGLGLNYTSGATAQRRSVFNEQATMAQIIHRSTRETLAYFSRYVVGNSAPDHVTILIAILGGTAIGLFAIIRFGIPKDLALVIRLCLFSILSLIMAVSTVFVCFVVVLKGYGITSYLVPRFEITYNVWLSVFFVSVGFIIAALIAWAAKYSYGERLLTFVLTIITLGILVGVPHMLHQASYRLRSVAVFSANWDYQDSLLRQDAANHVHTATIPVIDIGDAYNIRCDNNSSDDWLGVSKQQYYNVPEICSTPE